MHTYLYPSCAYFKGTSSVYNTNVLHVILNSVNCVCKHVKCVYMMYTLFGIHTNFIVGACAQLGLYISATHFVEHL